MHKTLAGIAAAGVLIAVSGATASAAPLRQDTGIHQQVAGEEFGSQRRYRRSYARRYYGPGVYYGYSGNPYPYSGYGYGYGYPYYAPPPFIGFGPFGIW
jgi:hypothetical protein